MKTDLFERLREATAPVHHALENDLDLLGQPPSRERFIQLLQRFFGFHAVWEPAVANLPSCRAVSLQRSRLPNLASDLGALGLDADALAALPRCLDARRLARTPETALGSLYVLEGSTLGGQVISRALAQAPWRPEGGLSYFDPYGRETGAQWRAFKDWARAACPEDAWTAIIHGAMETFELLHGWLVPVTTVAA